MLNMFWGDFLRDYLRVYVGTCSSKLRTTTAATAPLPTRCHRSLICFSILFPCKSRSVFTVWAKFSLTQYMFSVCSVYCCPSLPVRTRFAVPFYCLVLLFLPVFVFFYEFGSFCIWVYLIWESFYLLFFSLLIFASCPVSVACVSYSLF